VPFISCKTIGRRIHFEGFNPLLGLFCRGCSAHWSPVMRRRSGRVGSGLLGGPSYDLAMRISFLVCTWRCGFFMRVSHHYFVACRYFLWFLAQLPPGASVDAPSGDLVKLSGCWVTGCSLLLPLCFNWQMCIADSLLFGAREVAVSALATVSPWWRRAAFGHCVYAVELPWLFAICLVLFMASVYAPLPGR